MAVSGRKVPEFKDLLSSGSTEYFDVCCDPCKVLGQIVEAKGFCVNCQENLCKRCVDYHKSTKASRHHQLLDQPQKLKGGTSAASDYSTVCTKYCNIHKKEVIMFFCSCHDKVGCWDCMTSDHVICKIDYIPDVCSGILKSTEFSGTLQNISKTLKEVKSIVDKAQSKKAEHKTSLAGVIKEIEKFQKEMNDRIEELKQQLVTEANSHRTNRDQEVDKILESCARVNSELKQVLTSLTECQTNQLDAQAFVTIKQAKWILSSTNFQVYEQDLNNVLNNILFEPNSELEDVLSQQYGFGRIVLPFSKCVKESKTTFGIAKSTDASVTIKPEFETSLYCFRQKKSIKVKTKSDKIDCYISSCSVISADRLLLSDYWNNKLKIVNTDTGSVVEEMTVDPFPWDVTVLPRDQVAVTVPDKQKLVILETAGKLRVIRNMNIGRQGWGIAYHQDHLFVVCQQPNSLLVLDTIGNVQRDIPLHTALYQPFNKPLYIAVGKDRHTLYISDWKSRLVVSLTLEGHVIGVYKHNELNEPRGLIMLEDCSLLVCCQSSGTIHQIFADLKQGRTLIKHVPTAGSICFHPGNRQIIVGAMGKDLSIFKYE